MSTHNKIKICVAICTRQRPKMLKRLFESITELKIPPNVTVCCVVVENGPDPQSAEVLEPFRADMEINYVQESQVGLVHSRNNAIERSLETDADWIAFVDDDEWIDHEWLQEYTKAIVAFPEGRAFAGPINRIDPETATKWFPRHKTAHGKTGVKVWNAGTGNIMFQRSIYATDGANMRFDQRFNLSGGEDTFLFLSMRRKGIPMLWVQDALCSEDVLPSRATLEARVGRTIRYMHNFGMINQIFYGPVIGRLKNFAHAFKMLFHSVSYVLAGIGFTPFNRARALSYIAISVQKFSTFIGYGRALFLPLKPVYTEVDGH